MTECPDLAAFEGGPLSVELARHVGDCPACRFVLELIEDRSADGDECSRFETLLAARADGSLGRAGGKLLARHLARCARCREVADTLAPTGDAAGDLLTLPEVDPASYELGLEIARGGMGRIRAARDLRIGREVAIKELIGRTPALATRFEREARVTAKLQHPGIVPIYEIGRWPDGTPFYSMRMVDGRTLRDAIDDAPTLARRLALLPAVIAATDAVAFAHGKRVIHRDLTPSNILVGAYGETVVIDWGLAKDLSARDELGSGDEDDDEDDDDHGDGVREGGRLTGLGSVIGTAGYMPPEQAHARAVDERADVYALGAILYHVLAGRPPYEPQGTERVLAAVRTGPPPPIQERAPGVPRDLASIVGKAMAYAPDQRYPSARELSDELRRWSGGRLVAAHAYTTGERLRRLVARNRAPLAVLSIAAFGLALLAWVSVRRIIDSQAHSERVTRSLLSERGRMEALAGHPQKALAYLGAAHDAEERSPALDFLLAGALRDLDDLEVTFDCGADVQWSAVSPDGVHVAAACGDVGRIWRLDDHGLVHSFGPAPGGFFRAAYAADGAQIAFIGMDGVARVYDAATGARRFELVHRAGTALNRALWSKDSARLVTTGDDGQAVVWDARSGARLRSITAGYLGFLGVYGLLSPDGRTLLTATLGGVGRGWDVESGVELGAVDHGGQMLGGDLSSDGALAVTCGADRRARVWDLKTLAARLTLAGHGDVIWRCFFSPDGARLLTTSHDGTAKVWDLASGTMITSVDAGDIVWWGEFSPDGRLIVTVTLEGAAQVWDARTGALLTSHPSAGTGAHVTGDGRLVMERADGKLQVWRRAAGPRRHQLAPAGGEVREVTRDGLRAIVARAGGLEVWDVAAGTPLAHAALAPPYALAAGGRRLAALGGAGVIVVELDRGATVATLPLTQVRGLALDATGARLLAIAAGAPPAVLDVPSGAVRARLTGATDAVLSDDGRRALAWHDGGAPAVWTIDAAAPPVALTAADDGLIALGFSADGRRVAALTGPAATVWSTDDGRVIVAVPVDAERARWDPGGRMITAIGPESVVRTVRAEDGALVSSFAGERLTGAQIDAAGELVVATDRRDSAVSVLDATDGRVLAQWAIERAGVVTTDQRFTLGRNAAWWTPDGGAIVTRAGAVTVWDAPRLPADPTARLARALRASPWRVVDGQLREVRARVGGRVTREGLPVADATVAVTFRDVPRRAARTSWSSTVSQPRTVIAVTAADGSYLIRDLPAGDYTLVARSPRDGCTSVPLVRTMAELDQVVDVALSACGGPGGPAVRPSGPRP